MPPNKWIKKQISLQSVILSDNGPGVFRVEREMVFLSDVKRAIQVAKDMRLPVSGYRTLPDGSIEVLTSPPAAAPKPATENGRPNSFDQVLGQ